MPVSPHSLHPRTLWKLFLGFLAATVLISAGMWATSGSLTNDLAPHGIVSFEFVGDSEAAAAMLDSWGERGRIEAAFNLGLDFLFILAWVPAVAIGCLWVAQRFGRFVMALRALATLQIVAGMFDMIENVALLNLLLTTPSEPWPQIAWWAALLKFSILALGVVAIAAGAVVAGAKRA
ncbi:hypothetical protein [Hoyosella altamirensis]|uniref:DUF4386 domain-containing protein n=1 Tax=Hoyosella altamirensis TaxID=616997 RepID=A0A839RLT7_9ACTN|nr:hypothetical protein [Hoyosella altamirensis]MBB3037158.1 hypothetical protein [Hoyosella altamirensis]